jgi:hypothetical protein
MASTNHSNQESLGVTVQPQTGDTFIIHVFHQPDMPVFTNELLTEVTKTISIGMVNSCYWNPIVM